MDRDNDKSRAYAILCGETSDAIDYLENLVERLKVALSTTEEMLITDDQTGEIHDEDRGYIHC